MTQPPFDLPEPTGDLQRAMDEIVHDPVAERTRPTGDPSTWQRQFEAELAAIKSRSAGLGEAMKTIVGTGENAVFVVEVGPTGRLLDLRFRPGARGKSEAEWDAAFAEAYANGRRDAATQLSALLTESGLSPDPEANPETSSSIALADEPTD